jgi:hypothetical protein
MPYFRRKILRLNYFDVTKNTYTQVKGSQIIVREVLKNERCYAFVDDQVHIKARRNL